MAPFLASSPNNCCISASVDDFSLSLLLLRLQFNPNTLRSAGTFLAAMRGYSAGRGNTRWILAPARAGSCSIAAPAFLSDSGLRRPMVQLNDMRTSGFGTDQQ